MLVMTLGSVRLTGVVSSQEDFNNRLSPLFFALCHSLQRFLIHEPRV